MLKGSDPFSAEAISDGKAACLSATITGQFGIARGFFGDPR